MKTHFLSTYGKELIEWHYHPKNMLKWKDWDLFLLECNKSMNYEINDVRKSSEFKGITFSGFKKKEAQEKLIDALKISNIEDASYFSIEFICAGHLFFLCDLMIFFYVKYIHVENPKLSYYLHKRIDVINNMITKDYYQNELSIRNNKVLREMICEMICVLCTQKQNLPIEYRKIPIEDFSSYKILQNVKSTKNDLIHHLFKEDDPQEFYICLNEIYFHLVNKNKEECNYWIEWYFEFDNQSSKVSKKYASIRNWVHVDELFKSDTIWILWDILFDLYQPKSKVIKIAISSLFHLYCFDFNKTNKKKKKNIFYFIVSLLCINEHEKYDLLSMINENQKNICKNAISILPLLYEEVKKNEVTIPLFI
jgi:hypothetical protein